MIKRISGPVYKGIRSNTEAQVISHLHQDQTPVFITEADLTSSPKLLKLSKCTHMHLPRRKPQETKTKTHSRTQQQPYQQQHKKCFLYCTITLYQTLDRYCVYIVYTKKQNKILKLWNEYLGTKSATKTSCQFCLYCYIFLPGIPTVKLHET